MKSTVVRNPLELIGPSKSVLICTLHSLEKTIGRPYSIRVSRQILYCLGVSHVLTKLICPLGRWHKTWLWHWSANIFQSTDLDKWQHFGSVYVFPLNLFIELRLLWTGVQKRYEMKLFQKFDLFFGISQIHIQKEIFFTIC